MPSMVTSSAPSTCRTGTRQLFTRSPLRKTEQAPHSPSPHPSFVPVNSNSWRSTSSRRAIGWTRTLCRSPFTISVTRTFGTLTRGISMDIRLHSTHHFHKILRHQWHMVDTDTDRIFNRINNRRSRAVHRQFAESLGLGSVSTSDEKHANGRHIDRGWNDVVCHL